MKRSLVVSVTALLLASPAAASRNEYCANHFPSVTLDYNTELARVVAVFDLDRCLKVDADLAVSGTFSREGVAGDGGVAQSMRICRSSKKRCRLMLEWEHEPVERADYQANVSYFAKDREGALQAGVLTLVATCTSAVAISDCGL